MDMKKLMAQAQKMQSELQKKMEEFDTKLFDFVYKDLVKLEIYGSLKIKKITILDNSLIDKNDKDMLEDVIGQAVNNAIEALIKGKTEITNKIAGPGLDGLF